MRVFESAELRLQIDYDVLLFLESSFKILLVLLHTGNYLFQRLQFFLFDLHIRLYIFEGLLAEFILRQLTLSLQ